MRCSGNETPTEGNQSLHSQILVLCSLTMREIAIGAPHEKSKGTDTDRVGAKVFAHRRRQGVYPPVFRIITSFEKVFEHLCWERM